MGKVVNSSLSQFPHAVAKLDLFPLESIFVEVRLSELSNGFSLKLNSLHFLRVYYCEIASSALAVNILSFMNRLFFVTLSWQRKIKVKNNYFLKCY